MIVVRRLCSGGDMVLFESKTPLDPEVAKFLRSVLAGEEARGNLLVARRPGEKVPHALSDLAEPTEAEEILSVPNLKGG